MLTTVHEKIKQSCCSSYCTGTNVHCHMQLRSLIHARMFKGKDSIVPLTPNKTATLSRFSSIFSSQDTVITIQLCRNRPIGLCILLVQRIYVFHNTQISQYSQFLQRDSCVLVIQRVIEIGYSQKKLWPRTQPYTFTIIAETAFTYLSMALYAIRINKARIIVELSVNSDYFHEHYTACRCSVCSVTKKLNI